MSPENAEFSKEGIKISYRRYLSDSASGYILILLAIIAYYNNVSLLGFQLSSLLSPTALNEVKIFILLLAFFLSTPVGLAINVFSWALLEYPQKQIEKFLQKRAILKAFKQEYLFKDSTEKLNLSESNWFERIRLVETALGIEYAVIIERIDPLRGVTIFLRNLSFLSLLGLTYSISILNAPVSIILLVISVIFLTISAVTSFYFHVHLAYWGYVLIHHNQDSFLNKLIDDKLFSQKKNSSKK